MTCVRPSGPQEGGIHHPVAKTFGLTFDEVSEPYNSDYELYATCNCQRVLESQQVVDILLLLSTCVSKRYGHTHTQHRSHTHPRILRSGRQSRSHQGPASPPFSCSPLWPFGRFSRVPNKAHIRRTAGPVRRSASTRNCHRSTLVLHFGRSASRSPLGEEAHLFQTRSQPPRQHS